jgi:hypothetical protein
MITWPRLQEVLVMAIQGRERLWARGSPQNQIQNLVWAQDELDGLRPEELVSMGAPLRGQRK